MSLLLSAQHKMNAINVAHLFGVQLGIATGHHNQRTRMVAYKPVNRLTTFLVGYLCDATRIYHAHVGYLTLPDRAYTRSLEFLSDGTGFSKIEFTAQCKVGRLLTLIVFHNAKL